MEGETGGPVQRRCHRVRGRRIGAGAAVAAGVLVLSACGGGADGVELERGESGVLPAVEPPESEDSEAVDVEGVTVEVPEGWEVEDEDGALCLTPPGQSACGFGSVRLEPHSADRHPDGWPLADESFHEDDGWADDTGSCRSLNSAESGNIGVEDATRSHTDVFEHADALKSHHTVWDVTCVNDDTFEVRMWFLPESDVLLYVWSADAQYDEVYDEIAASMDTTAYQN